MADVNININAQDNASSTLSALGGSLNNLKGAAESAAAAFGLFKFAKFAEESTLLAARNEQLGVVMRTVGANVGIAAADMDKYSQQVSKMGVTTEQSRLAVTKLASAHLDLSKAADLARLAQDAGRVAGISTSQALEGIIAGITTMQPEVLRTYGLVINQDQAWQKLASSMNKTVDQLTPAQKQMATMNAVMEKAPDIANVYANGLDTLGGRVQSIGRYIEENKAAFGEMFTAAGKVGVDLFIETMKDLGNWFLKNKDFVRDFSKGLVSDLKSAIDIVKGAFEIAKDIIGLLPSGLTSAGAAIKVAEFAMGAFVVASLSGIAKVIQAAGALRTALLATTAVSAGAGAASAATGAGAVAAGGGLMGLLSGIGATSAAGLTLAAGVGYGAYKLTGAGLGWLGDKTGWGILDAYRSKPAGAAGDATAAGASAQAGNDAAVEAGKKRMEEQQAQEQAYLAEQERKKTYEARMKLEDDKTKLAIQKAKERADFELAVLKDEFDKGLIATNDYYNKVKASAKSTLDQELELVRAQEKRIKANLDGTSGEKLNAEQKIKAQSDLLTLEGKESELIAKNNELNRSSDAARRDGLKAIQEQMAETRASQLRASGEYVAAVELELQKEKSGAAWRKLEHEAERGNLAAEILLMDKKAQQSVKLAQANLDQYKAQQEMATAIRAIEQEYFKVMGWESENINLVNSLYDSKVKQRTIELQLEVAIANQNQTAIDGLKEQLRLQALLIQKKEQDIDLEERRLVLNGEIVGYDNGTAIYRDAWRRGQAQQYVSNADLLGGSGGFGVSGSGFFNTNVFASNLNAPFLGGFAVGTDYVPRDGFAFIHEGEAIVPKKQNASGGVSVGGITVNVQGGGTSSETAREIARKIAPELQAIMGRFR